LPVGGLKEKMLTAYRAGLKTVVIPKRNKKDLVEIPRRVKRGVSVILVEEMEEVLAQALLSPPSTPDA
jgi:ATP-dependent Lon protease